MKMAKPINGTLVAIPFRDSGCDNLLSEHHTSWPDWFFSQARNDSVDPS